MPFCFSHYFQNIFVFNNLFKLFNKNNIMVKINFHLHSTGSDGKSNPEQVVEESIANGINFICFTDHYRRPGELETGWNTSGFHPNEYIQNIRNLQKKYQDKIDISYGVEFDWLPNHTDWIKKELAKSKFDFILGSVHLLFHKDKIGHFMFRNGESDKWQKASEEFGGVKNMVIKYYKSIREMIKSGLFDCVAHMDVIKMHNPNSMFFSEEELWYKHEVIKTLDILKKSKMAMEINTSGLTRDVLAPYPSLWILKEAKKRNIPLTIGTDAHIREAIAKELGFAYRFAKEAGYSEIVRFKDRKMISISI
jgi:histidinol-phosphatase (PHP family)